MIALRSKIWLISFSNGFSGLDVCSKCYNIIAPKIEQRQGATGLIDHRQMDKFMNPPGKTGRNYR